MGKHYRWFEPLDKEERLQKCFKLIRMASGFTASEVADKIGCSRQLVTGIESGKLRVTYATYVGIEGLVTNSKSSFLQDLWDILVDNEGYSDDFRELAYDWGKVVAGALAHGVITQDEADAKWSVVVSEL